MITSTLLVTFFRPLSNFATFQYNYRRNYSMLNCYCNYLNFNDFLYMTYVFRLILEKGTIFISTFTKKQVVILMTFVYHRTYFSKDFFFKANFWEYLGTLRFKVLKNFRWSPPHKFSKWPPLKQLYMIKNKTRNVPFPSFPLPPLDTILRTIFLLSRVTFFLPYKAIII